MIKLTRFNHSEIVINADLIEFVEATPDTVVSSVTGKKLLVLEPVDEVIRRVVAYRSQVRPLIPLGAALAETETSALAGG